MGAGEERVRMARHVLLTGAPGCGKTTVVRSVASALVDSGAPVRGFWTEETRERGRRTGFRIQTLSGKDGMLARVGLRSPYEVGRYGVDLAALDSVAVAEIEEALAAPNRARLIVIIDEIGRMELFSTRFRRAVERAFDQAGHVVATIMLRPHPFADALRRRPDVAVVTITPQNRDGLPAEILRSLR
jgi:nucleoside-triphosphatase